MLERHWLKVATRTMMQFPGAKLMFISQKGCSIRDENRINFAKFGVGSVPVDSIRRNHGCKFEFSVPESVISKTKQTTLL